MWTNYIKNFSRNEFENICKRFDLARLAKTPLWRGTVFIGIEPLYIECHVKWIADKIDEYFVNTLPNQHIDNARELYILNDGVDKFTQSKLSEYSDLFFLGDNIFTKPDLITNKDFIFLRDNNKFFISVPDADMNHILYLDEIHILGRFFYYILQKTTVLHGAAIAYNDFGVFIAGLSGSGKSTLAAHCMAKGLQFVGDDKIALHKKDDILYANPIYSVMSLKETIDGIKTVDIKKQKDADKDVLVLEKSQIAHNIQIDTIIEPTMANIDNPEILKTPISPIITRICNDFSIFSVLSPNKNPLNDYKTIFNLFSNIDSYKLNLSKSLPTNIEKLIDFVKFRRL